MQAAASSSALPPISPIMTTASVAGSPANSASASMKLVPISGSPPMPMQVVWPSPSLRQLVDRLVGQRAALRDDADAPFLADVPGNDAGLGLPGGDEAGTVRADEPRLRRRGSTVKRAHHVERRDAFGDADGERQTRRRPLP